MTSKDEELKNNTYSKEELVSCISNYFEKREWDYIYEKNSGIFRLSGMFQGAQYANLVIHVQADAYIIYADSGIQIKDRSRMAKASAYLHRVNDRMLLCNFNLDVDTGAVQCRCSHFCWDTLPSQSLFFFTIMLPLLMLRMYGPGLMDVVYKDMDPVEAVAAADTKRWRE